MVCPKCGHGNSDEDRFCGECGEALTAGADGGPSSPNPAQSPPVGNRATFYPTSTAGSGAKSKMTAGILGIVLGAFGIHRFYLGYTVIGIVQIIVTLVTAGLGGIWGFIEGVLILTGSFNKDANGNPLGD